MKRFVKSLSNAQIIYIGLSKAGPYIAASLVINSMLIFYTDYVGMEPVVFGIAYAIFGWWNAINNPILGYYSDRLCIEGKKRVSLLKTSFPILIAGFLIILFQTMTPPLWVTFILLLLGMVIYEGGKALFEVNFDAYTLAVVIDPQDRTVMNMLIGYISIFPGAIAGIVPTYFLTGNYTYNQLLLIFALMLFIPNAISFYCTAKLRPLAEVYADLSTNAEPKISDLNKDIPERVPTIKAEEPIPIGVALKQTITSKPFQYQFAFRMFSGFYQGIYYANLIYMFNGVLGISGAWTLIISGAGGVVMNALYPILAVLRKKFGTIPTLLGCDIVGIIGYIIMFFAMDPWGLFFGYALSTVAMSGLIFEKVLLGDITDKDFMDTGKEKRAMFSSIYSFFDTLFRSFAVLLVTLVLSVTGYISDLKGVQAPNVQFGIRFMSSIIPIIALMICIVIMKYYPLQGKAYEEFRKDYLKFMETQQN